ncbi:hypothetical protein [Methylocucumis oryzae]|uniref:Uncharacterized protein n=1 Tax=Methylocucumis oryzae TaxID=1632867 RepID=A0A0F3IJI3_9GAMM|nr:hypothetical protein [Methylocucumis oryzae]KJV06866.1 hypothetical protein VZ94_08455 [Methylocucumis oryzae]
MYLKIPFAKRLAKRFKQQLVQGEQVIPLGFADDDETANGIIHSFYSMLKIDDVLTTFGLLNTHQLLKLPETENYYIVVFSIARHDGRFYSDEEKHLFAHCFELFLADFKRKIACAEHCAYLPYLCLEKFKPRELASIKACFDLKLNQQAVTRVNLANALHKTESSENLKQALYKVDYDLAKIKKLIFTDIKNTTDATVIALINDFDWPDVAEVFKLYAYFGFYPDLNHYWYSNLPSKMGGWVVR